MENSNNKTTTKSLSPEYKVLAKNTLLSIFSSYGNYIFALMTSFLLARMISRDEWAILILATSLIMIFSIVPNFLPPGIIISLNFYIPRYKAKKQLTKLRSFILKAFYLRIISVMIITSIGLFVIIVFNGFFTIYLQNHISLLYILFPLIIISGFETLFIATLIGFNLFKINIIVLIIKSIINVIPLFSYFLIAKTIEIEIVAFINLISAIIPFIFVSVIFFIKVSKLKDIGKKGLNNKDFIRKVVRYGSFLRIQRLIGDLWKQVETITIGIYEKLIWVTGFSISKNYTRISGLFLTSLNSPLIYSFSSLDYNKNEDKIKKMFLIIYRFSSFSFLLITGILFFFSNFFLSFVYGEDFVVYSIMIQILLISGALSIYGSLYLLLLRTTNRIKQLVILFVTGFPIQITIFFATIINFGILGMLIADLIQRIISLVMYSILSVKVIKINLNILKVVALFFSYFFSLFLVIILGDLFLNEISYQFWSVLNLMIFKDLNIIKILIFALSFIFLNILFRTISKVDIEYIELLFTKDSFTQKNIKKLLGLFKRFLR